MLPTETPHEKTKGLHQLVKSDLSKAIELLKDIDQDCLNSLDNLFLSLRTLHRDISDTFQSGGRVYLCGCGATGRLSLALERIYLDLNPNSEKVSSFMAGGDVALISSIESFEDYPEYGARQLRELDFKENDLLIGSSEGGETPWVIGVVEEASLISKRSPYFLFCNPVDILISNVERSKKIIENSSIKNISLYCGPMALTGSTRMQASTILMLGIGISLIGSETKFDELHSDFLKFKAFFEGLELNWLESFIKEEANLYSTSGYCHYQSSAHLGISILTDTTERSPTFSLPSFENQDDEQKIPSLFYFSTKTLSDNAQAWRTVLGRKPRTLDWEESRIRTSENRFYGFDVSNQIFEKRKKYLTGDQELFSIELERDAICFKFLGEEYLLGIPDFGPLYTHILLKMILNTHSTLIMGMLDRYDCNIMTWVKPSNNKLIDRTARNIHYLLEFENLYPSYEDVIYKIFELRNQRKPGHSLVNMVVDNFKSSV